MSKIGKICFVLSLVAFLCLGTARLIYGGWHESFWFPFALIFIFFALGVWKDHLALKELMFMRSTKHGMNLGALVILVVVGLVCVNFFAARYDKKSDWTSERLNSLSEQSVKAAKGLKQDTELVLVYRKESQEENIQRAVSDIAAMYTNESSKLRFVAYNGLQRPDLAQKFDFTSGQFVFYAVQGERKVKIDPPNEEGVTRALIKLGRDKKKVIYFTRGHGELLLDDKDENGLSFLKDDLSVTYDVKSLALFETGNKVPDDADIVAVVGPKQQLLPVEIDALRDFARRGGNLFLALDPGQRHNLSLLTRSFGVEFSNQFVFDLRSQALRSSPSLVLGTEFSRTSEITKAFRSNGNQMALFLLASSVKKAIDAPSTLAIEDLIRTDKTTASVPELKEKLEYRPNGPHTLAVTVTGELPPSGDKASAGKKMNAVVFADSDFMNNRLIHNNMNRDLVGNSFAWLTNDTELITIRPKEPKTTRLDLMTGSFYALALGLLALSFALLGTGITFWWRRRTA